LERSRESGNTLGIELIAFAFKPAGSDLLDPISRQLLEETPDAVVLMLASTMVVEANDAASRLLGTARANVEGSYANQWLISDSNRLTLSLEELFESGQSIPEQVGYRVIDQAGSLVSVILSATRIGSSDQPLFFWVSLRKERHRPEVFPIEVSAQFNHKMLESMPGAVLALDMDGNHRYVNPAFSALIGLPREELIGKGFPYPYFYNSEKSTFLATLTQQLDEPISSGIALQLRHRDGRHIDVLFRPSLLVDGLDKAIGWIISVTDVSELKRAEAAWRASEQRFRSLCACSPVGIFMASSEGLLTWTNSRFQLLSGLTNEQSLGTGWFDAVHPDDRESIATRWEILSRASRPFESTFRFQSFQGQVRWARGITSPIKTDEGRTLGHVGLLEDITEQRQAEEVRRSLESQRQELVDRLQLLLATMPVACIVLDQNYITEYWNRSAERMFGYSPEETRGKHLFDLIFPRNIHQRVNEYFTMLSNGETIVDVLLESQTLDVRRISCQWSFSPLQSKDGSFFGLLCMAQDVTDRRRSEETIRESERRYRLLADYSTDMISRHDLTGVYLYVSPACTHLTGYSPSELIGRSAYSLVHPDDRHLYESNRLVQLEGQLSSDVTFRLIRKDGRVVWVEAMTHFLRDNESGSVLEFQVTSRDVTLRKAAEEALRRSEGRFRALVEKSSDGFALLDDDRILLYASPATTRILGYPVDLVNGRSVKEFVHEEDMAEFDQLHSSESLRIRGASTRTQMRARHLDRTWRDLEVIITNYLDDPDIRSWVLNYRDITEQVRLEEQLRQSQKMEAIGKLAGGIAHDFNNILTAIIVSVNEVLRCTPETSPLRSWLTTAETSAKRAAELTSQLLGFSRRTNLRMKSTILRKTLDEALIILKVSLDPRIHIQVSSPVDLWPVMADATQMTSVLVNLCINSRDSMPRGGCLKISLTNEHISDEYARRYVFARPGEFICLQVEDTGSGIPADVKERIFEPFFTTKPTGKGTGLGLAMVYGTVKAHGGWIVCDSEVGRGTRFDILLPRTEHPPEEEQVLPEPEKEIEMPTPNGTVLLVDDEPAIRMLAKRVLEMQGHRILLAEDGIDALEQFEELHNEIDLVILDLTMPRLSGQDTYKRMREIDPNVQVLFSSGYSADAIEDLAQGVGFITKPYRPDELTRAVREALAKRV
jgi:two-component system, cell cycle sensor histidine kinase and response regulator CckA